MVQAGYSASFYVQAYRNVHVVHAYGYMVQAKVQKKAVHEVQANQAASIKVAARYGGHGMGEGQA